MAAEKWRGVCVDDVGMEEPHTVRKRREALPPLRLGQWVGGGFKIMVGVAETAITGF